MSRDVAEAVFGVTLTALALDPRFRDADRFTPSAEASTRWLALCRAHSGGNPDALVCAARELLERLVPSDRLALVRAVARDAAPSPGHPAPPAGPRPVFCATPGCSRRGAPTCTERPTGE